MKVFFGTILDAAFLAGHGMAQSVCSPTPMMYEQLSDDQGESRVAVGMVATGEMLELWAGDRSGTWSLLVTRPDGVTCVVAVGVNFERVERRPNL